MTSQIIKGIAKWTTILTMASAATLTLATFANAADEYNVVNGYTLSGHPLGLHGVDPVSMFGDQGPVVGDATHAMTHDGIDYYFATAKAKQAFEANPAAICPNSVAFVPTASLSARNSMAMSAMPISSRESSTFS